MGILSSVIKSKFVERAKRLLLIKSGVFLKLKKLSASASPDYRTVKILESFGFDLVLDIGANTGQFAESLLDFGYGGAIVSFEPTNEAYKELKGRASKYKNWKIADKCAIGREKGNLTINISKNTVFNSIKTIKTDYAAYNEDSQIIGTETVNVETLDDLNGKVFNASNKTLLKIDTQGFEKEVLAGAEKVLSIVGAVKLEVPLLAIYDDVTLNLKEIINFFDERNFTCISLNEVAVNNASGVVNEVDAIFVRKAMLS
jgi:FkbM family methyltransferase